jgi:hypothetical protein
MTQQFRLTSVEVTEGVFARRHRVRSSPQEVAV